MEGIVINTIDYKEKSKIVYLYTPNGINSVKALDVMKKNLGFIVTLNHVEYNVSNGKFPTVLEYNLIKSYSATVIPCSALFLASSETILSFSLPEIL